MFNIFAPSTGGMMNEFLADLKTRGVTYDDHFTVHIHLPSQLNALFNTHNLTARCEQTVLPGITFQTNENKVNGLTYRVPFQSTYDQVTLNFILDSRMYEKRIFDGWCNLIKNPDDTYNYYDEYVGDIVISQHNEENDHEEEVSKNYSVKLINAFPMEVNPIDLNWSSDGICKLAVTFAYERWYSLMTMKTRESDKYSGIFNFYHYKPGFTSPNSESPPPGPIPDPTPYDPSTEPASGV